MGDPMERHRSLGDKLYTARHIFIKPPGLIQRLRLYRKFRRFSRQWQETEDFNLKIRDVCAAPDNQFIPRSAKAGELVNGHLVMHNGLSVVPDSYAGEGMTRLLAKNRGVHEPQEELAFMEVLNRIKKQALPCHTMIELGSYWAFYSLWFSTELPGANCYCVEPELKNLEFGKRNFNINRLTAEFTQAYVGTEPQNGSPPVVSVDSLVREKQIQHVDILHADIQGFELEMLNGARESLGRGIIDFIFISSHHNFLHYRCIDELLRSDFKIVAEVDLLETYSTDGVIVAARNGLPCVDSISVTPRRI